MTQLLRIEAINLSSSIEDSEDLSTRRGGGYMLLQAINDIETRLHEEIESISTGASIGLFEIKTGVDKNKLFTDATDILTCKKSAYQHATFAITIVEGNNFRSLVEQSISKVRWQQMRTLNFTTHWGNSSEICETDKIRPAAAKEKPKGRATSLSVASRFKEGRKLRQDFYRRELDHDDLIKKYNLESILSKDNKLPFTNETETLTKFPPKAPEFQQIPANLNGKMAVFYADGNSFGKIQQVCSDAAALRDWDKEIKAKRRKLLAQLLNCLQNTSLGKTDNNELRFETLLWGGDELLFILPAWLGLEFAQKFFELTRCWRHQMQPLTHAAGLVFASHAAPISQLQNLAKKLADHGKAADRDKNTLSWIVLESFDHAGDKMENYWQRNAIDDCDDKNGWQKLLLTRHKLEGLRSVITPIKNELPRSAMVRVLRSIASRKTGEGDEFALLQRSYESINDALHDEATKRKFKALWKNLSGNDWHSTVDGIPPEDALAWTIILELWDYLLHDAFAPTTGGDQ